MELALSDVEIVCLKKLAVLFAQGKEWWTCGAGWESIGLTPENFYPVLTSLERYGYINKVTHTTGSPFSMFKIDASAVQAVRAIAAQEEKRQEGKDIVELVRLTLRKHPVTAWTLILLTALLAVVTGLNQFISLFKNLGWIQ